MSAVSVVVPCYNCEKTVERTLDSLRNQTLKDLEIIAINDGSEDNTLKVLQNYQKQYSELNLKIFSKENEGIAEARNFGLSRVSGEYFGFLDSDDYAEPCMFEDLYRKAASEHLELAVSDFWWENSKGRKLQKEGPYEIGPDMMVSLFAVLWNKLYQTSFIRSLDISFPKGDRYEDACFLYCLTCRLTKIGFVDQPYVHYVQQQKSITHTNNDQVKNMIEVFQIIQKYYRDHGCFEEYRDALEYIHIKFFLGNSFLRSARIENKEDREHTIRMGWDLLNTSFPDWHHNPYLKSLGGMKNRYFAMVNEHNLMFFAWLFRHFKKDNL